MSVGYKQTKMVVGGGYVTNAFTEITNSRASDTQDSWVVAGFPEGGAASSLQAQAICFDNPPL
jgi:hypothetical protein